MAEEDDQSPKVSALWVKTAWIDDSDGAWMLSAYDEWTFESWGEEPDFYLEQLQKARRENPGVVIREMYLDVPERAILDLFKIPTVPVTTTVPTDG